MQAPMSTGASRRMAKSQNKVPSQAEGTAGADRSQRTEHTLDCWLISNWEAQSGLHREP